MPDLSSLRLRSWLPLGCLAIGAAAALALVPGFVSSRTDAVPRTVAAARRAGRRRAGQHRALQEDLAVGGAHHLAGRAARLVLSLNVQQVPRGTGTGFVWDASGHIVTNFHVIQGANGAKVTLADQTTFDAELVGAFPDRDLAVLRIEAPKDKLPPIAVGSSRDLMVGQRVYAIGNPFGLDQTLTTGIVSALNREIESFNSRTIRGVIQTDAAINPGNSGGPLLDSAGRLIGVNTQIASPSGASAGIGFAIPVDEVNRIVPRLIRDGRFVRPAIGVSAGPPGLSQALKLPKGVALVTWAAAPGRPRRPAAVPPRQQGRDRARRRDHRHQRRAGGRPGRHAACWNAHQPGDSGDADPVAGRPDSASRRWCWASPSSPPRLDVAQARRGCGCLGSRQ
jgi:S1-C subfamily serine protease